MNSVAHKNSASFIKSVCNVKQTSSRLLTGKSNLQLSTCTCTEEVWLVLDSSQNYSAKRTSFIAQRWRKLVRDLTGQQLTMDILCRRLQRRKVAITAGTQMEMILPAARKSKVAPIFPRGFQTLRDKVQLVSMIGTQKPTVITLGHTW